MSEQLPQVVCALEFEKRALERSAGGKRLAACGITIQVSGPGREGIARWAGEHRKVNGPILLVGLAGALQTNHALGDTVQVATVRAPGGKSIATTWRAPENVQLPSANVTSTTRVVTASPAKRALALTTGASIVDLESQAFAEVGSDLGWRFGIIRAIGDTVDAPLPPSCDLWVDHQGKTAIRSLASSLLRAPSLLGRLRTIKRQSDASLARLGDVLAPCLLNEQAP